MFVYGTLFSFVLLLTHCGSGHKCADSCSGRCRWKSFLKAVCRILVYLSLYLIQCITGLLWNIVLFHTTATCCSCFRHQSACKTNFKQKLLKHPAQAHPVWDVSKSSFTNESVIITVSIRRFTCVNKYVHLAVTDAKDL